MIPDLSVNTGRGARSSWHDDKIKFGPVVRKYSITPRSCHSSAKVPQRSQFVPDPILAEHSPNFEGYLRDSMYWAQLSALLLDGVILSAEQLEATISEEIEALRR